MEGNSERGKPVHTGDPGLQQSPLINLVSTYLSKIAGKIKFHLKEWKSTSDQAILDIVKGCKFDFVENPDQIDQRETFTNIKEAAIIDNEIDKLAQIGVIEKVNHSEGEFISTIFLQPKSDGTHRTNQ